MRGVTFEMSFPRLAAARIAGFFSTSGFVAPFGPVRLRDLPDPKRVADDWVVVRPTVTGVCGSDIKQIFLDADLDNPLRALISFPHVLGHEVAAEVLGGRVHGSRARTPWRPHRRIARGFPARSAACHFLAAMQEWRPLCSVRQLHLRGSLAPGIHAGNCRDIPGGYKGSDRMIAHESMCFPIPDGVTDEQAALSDPFSVALHAIRKAPPKPGETALVYGCGPLGLLTVHALRRLYPDVRVVAIDLHPYLEPFALDMGAQATTSRGRRRRAHRKGGDPRRRTRSRRPDGPSVGHRRRRSHLRHSRRRADTRDRRAPHQAARHRPTRWRRHPTALRMDPDLLPRSHRHRFKCVRYRALRRHPQP